MRTNAEIETERYDAAAKRDAEDPGWRDRYPPGSFGCHEALHAASIAQSMIDGALLEHGAILANPEWYRLASKASEAVAELYQAIGAAHNVAESEAP